MHVNKRNFWITASLFNLALTAFLGLCLRSKFLFPIPFINYRHFISAHSHFAFGGWITLALMIFFIYYVLPENLRGKPVYQKILWGIEITALGMAISFPFGGYTIISTLFSTLFIFLTYGFVIVYIKDILKTNINRSVKCLSVAALVSLFISSIGPWTLAYILASGSGNSNLYREAVYTYLHFQYNGFFTLSIFAIFFQGVMKFVDEKGKKRLHQFTLLLIATILPTLFLSLLYYGYLWIKIVAWIGSILIFITMARFFLLKKYLHNRSYYAYPIAGVFWLFSMLSFMIKMLLQMGISIPGLGDLVFGYRPIIIGFLHLIFLGFVSFFILCVYIESHLFSFKVKLTNIALIGFAFAVILNETVLLVQGIGLFMGFNYPVYAWLLWIAAILLFLFSTGIATARMKSKKILSQTIPSKSSELQGT